MIGAVLIAADVCGGPGDIAAKRVSNMFEGNESKGIAFTDGVRDEFLMTEEPSYYVSVLQVGQYLHTFLQVLHLLLLEKSDVALSGVLLFLKVLVLADAIGDVVGEVVIDDIVDSVNIGGIIV